jgi:hydrogenase maturation protein HypF
MNAPRSTRNVQRLRVEIHGAVQGVGFRPFVYRLATELGLAGWVINDTTGVVVEVEGAEPELGRFLERISADKPPRAIIQSLQSAWLSPTGYDRFEIRHSDGLGAKTVLVLPDVATCPDCLAELLDPNDRRHRYPFTNCTNCGPRFSIIEALPYDRPNTTMRRFTMCPACQAEYDSPLDRRFHAQPNACPVCGPRLTFYPGGNTGAWECEGEEALQRAADRIRAGQIVAVKGLGGFHLMVDARNSEAINRLRERKPRHEKPFAVMVRDLDQARLLCEVWPEAEALLTSPEAPIIILRRHSRAANTRYPISEAVAPGNPNLGVMLPYTPLHRLLLLDLGFPVVATSGNLTDEPICTDEQEAMQRLGGIADAFLVHDRPIARHVDDSVAWIVRGEPRLMRRARGYAPLPVLLKEEIPTILAVGPHLKNTVALSVGRQVFISQHIGDLETPEAMAAFERVIADFLRLYEATPVAIAHDLHPGYLSTKWANEQRSGGAEEHGKVTLGHSTSAPLHLCSLAAVQHHHAHLAACLAENGVDGPALGVTWDGTGYGADGTIWGGEFLLGDASGFSRVAHLRPFRLPGGDAAIHEPRRVALALLWEMYGDAALEMDDLAPVRAFSPTERRLLAQMLARGLNAPITTSAGRLFDGIAALIGLQQEVNFEGQAAMALEFAADAAERGAYPIVLRGQGTGDRGQGSGDRRQELAEGGKSERDAPPLPRSSAPPLILDWQPLVETITTDVRKGVSTGAIAARFHNTLVEAIVAVAEATGEARVVLTGGCFQNRLLVEKTSDRLGRAGFEVLLHRQVPPNDGGISLGQIVVAAAQLRQGTGGRQQRTSSRKQGTGNRLLTTDF